ncbi:MAG: hypothetical protein COB59_04015 [Rhodospirillaceae bacterium]|nr:MAG: hypothetical protein COB59_04015 [Rhodospirillaceae bacterium]
MGWQRIKKKKTWDEKDAVGMRTLTPRNKALYRMLNIVERFFCTMKDMRRLATRYEKLSSNFWQWCRYLQSPYVRLRYRTMITELWAFCITFRATEPIKKRSNPDFPLSAKAMSE